MFTRDVATSGQGYSSLALAQSSLDCDRNETALTTVGIHYHPVYPGIVRNRLHKAGIGARRPYVGPPLTRTRRMRRMVWLTAHADETVETGPFT